MFRLVWEEIQTKRNSEEHLKCIRFVYFILLTIAEDTDTMSMCWQLFNLEHASKLISWAKVRFTFNVTRGAERVKKRK